MKPSIFILTATIFLTANAVLKPPSIMHLTRRISNTYSDPKSLITEHKRTTFTLNNTSTIQIDRHQNYTLPPTYPDAHFFASTKSSTSITHHLFRLSNDTHIYTSPNSSTPLEPHRLTICHMVLFTHDSYYREKRKQWDNIDKEDQSVQRVLWADGMEKHKKGFVEADPEGEDGSGLVLEDPGHWEGYWDVVGKEKRDPKVCWKVGCTYSMMGSVKCRVNGTSIWAESVMEVERNRVLGVFL